MQKKFITKNFKELKKTRAKILLPLLLLTVSSYFSFIWVIAFNPDFFALKVFETNISIGIVLGFLLILLIFLITFIYVFLANQKLEPLIKKIQKSV